MVHVRTVTKWRVGRARGPISLEKLSLLRIRLGWRRVHSHMGRAAVLQLQRERFRLHFTLYAGKDER